MATEYMITITLNPTFTSDKTMKEQLKKTYNFISSKPYKGLSNCPLQTGQGAVELTLNSNIHYHVKTHDPIYVIQAWLDSLKLHKTKINNIITPIFGFTKVDITKKSNQLFNYDYLHKNSESTASAWKRAKISSEFYTNWVYSDKAPKAVDTLSKTIKHKIFTIKNTPSTDSDTEIFLNI